MAQKQIKKKLFPGPSASAGSILPRCVPKFLSPSCILTNCTPRWMCPLHAQHGEGVSYLKVSLDQTVALGVKSLFGAEPRDLGARVKQGGCKGESQCWRELLWTPPRPHQAPITTKLTLRNDNTIYSLSPSRQREAWKWGLNPNSPGKQTIHCHHFHPEVKGSASGLLQ